MEIKSKNNGYQETLWMQGNRTPEGSYFVCQYRDDVYMIPGEKDRFVIYCKKFNKELASKADCGMDCEEFGYCDNCRGFSAIGCQVCNIPRPGNKPEK